MAWISVLLAVIGISSCNWKSQTSAQPSQKDVIHWTVAQWDVQSTQNRFCPQRTSLQELALTSKGLFSLGLDSENTWQVMPEIASHWKYRSPFEIEISLRDNLNWKNGKQITSSVIIAGWKKLLDSNCPSIRHELNEITHLSEYLNGKKDWKDVGLKTPNPKTIRISLTQPNPYFHWTLAHPSLFPSYRESNGKYEPNNLGPYQRAHSLSESPIMLVAKTSQPLPTFEIREVSDAGARLELFLQAEADFVSDLNDAMPLNFSNPSWLHYEPTYEVIYLALIPNRKLWLTKEARQAMLGSVDWSEWQNLNLKPEPAIQTLVQSFKGLQFIPQSLAETPVIQANASPFDKLAPSLNHVIRGIVDPRLDNLKDNIDHQLSTKLRVQTPWKQEMHLSKNQPSNDMILRVGIMPLQPWHLFGENSPSILKNLILDQNLIRRISITEPNSLNFSPNRILGKQIEEIDRQTVHESLFRPLALVTKPILRRMELPVTLNPFGYYSVLEKAKN